MKTTLLLSLIYIFSVTGIVGQDISLEVFTSGLINPTTITHAGDSRLFVAEKRGTVRIIRADGTLETIPFLDINSLVINTGSERGLLGISFHPNYNNNGWFFVSYNDNSGSSVIAKYRVGNDPDMADPNSGVILMTFSQPFTNHNGGCLKFGADGYLYIGSGDGGSAGDPGDRAQSGQNFLGKILRIDVDSDSLYAIPSNNPFVGNSAILDEIWALGLRNPWRFSFDRMTHDIWIGDVGQDAWEEINFQPANSAGGENYGWRCYEGTHPFNTTGCLSLSSYVVPVFEYQNTGTVGCSVTGGYVYRGGQFANLYGKYIFADYCSGGFWAITPDGQGGWNTTELDKFSSFQYAAFGEDQYGELFVAGHGNGTIYKLEEAACLPTAVILAEDSTQLPEGNSLFAVKGDGLTFQWKLNNSDIPGENDTYFVPIQSGNYSVEVTNSNSCINLSAEIWVELILPTSIHEIQDISEIHIYPMPNNSNFFLQSFSKTDLPVDITIINSRGQLVYSKTTRINRGESTQHVTTNLPAGLYWLCFKTVDGITSKRFVVQ